MTDLGALAHDAVLRERTRQIAKIVNPAAFETVHVITTLGPTDLPGIRVPATLTEPSRDWRLTEWQREYLRLVEQQREYLRRTWGV